MSSQHEKSGSTAALHQKFGKEKQDEELEGDEGEGEGQAAPEMLTHPDYLELQTKLTETEEKANQYWERLLRMQAESDNMSRRAERDIANAHKYGLEKFIQELLPIIDNLERAVEAHLEDKSFEGVSLTLKMLYPALQKFGLEQINPASQPFNPEWHQAVSTQAESGVKPGTVLNVLQKGYLLNSRLLRPALVVVSK